MAPGSPEPLSGIDRDAGGLAWTAGESLIRWKAGGGDTEEFERVALVHLDALYHIALRLTRNRAEAEDVVQEAFLRAFRSFHRFNPGTNCRAWLFTILRHVFLNRVRVQGREVLETEMGGLEQVQMTAEAPVGRNPEEQLLQTILHGDVDRALAALPLVFREAVMLVDIEGLTYREVAEVLGCPIGTVMSRLSRGRALLRRTLLRFAREHGYVKEQEGTAWRSRPGFTPTSTVSSR
jgi:RNA polymerase sigma-70 factor (ECF subfamily)